MACYDFVCELGHETEHDFQEAPPEVSCPTCNRKAALSLWGYNCKNGHSFQLPSHSSLKVYEECPECGETARAENKLGNFYCFVKNREWVYDPKKNVPNQAWKVGRSPEAQHRKYCQMMAAAKKRAHQARRDKGKRDDDGWQHIGRMPLEMHESIQEQMGDNQFMQKAAQSGELKQILKKTDTYLGDD